MYFKRSHGSLWSSWLLGEWQGLGVATQRILWEVGRGQFQAVVCTNAQAFVHRHVVWCLGETVKRIGLAQSQKPPNNSFSDWKSSFSTTSTELVGKKNTWIYGCLVQVFFQPSDPQIFFGSSGFFTPTSVEVSPIVSALIFRPLKMQMWPSVRWKMGINSPLKNAINSAAGTTTQLWQSGLLEAAGEWLQHSQGAVFFFFLGGGMGWEST